MGAKNKTLRIFPLRIFPFLVSVEDCIAHSEPNGEVKGEGNDRQTNEGGDDL